MGTLYWQNAFRSRPLRVLGAALVVVVTAVFAGLSWLSVRASIDHRPLLALVIVWLPMTWLGTVSHIVGLQLPERYHALWRFEQEGRCYERLGVRIVKKLLRRGPFALFNPGLHLPSDRSAEQLEKLEQRMRTAEATHFVLLVLIALASAVFLVRGAWGLAAETLGLDLLVNGYPVMLQRYNRALLRRRFAVLAPRSVAVRSSRP